MLMQIKKPLAAAGIIGATAIICGVVSACSNDDVSPTTLAQGWFNGNQTLTVETTLNKDTAYWNYISKTNCPPQVKDDKSILLSPLETYLLDQIAKYHYTTKDETQTIDYITATAFIPNKNFKSNVWVSNVTSSANPSFIDSSFKSKLATDLSKQDWVTDKDNKNSGIKINGQELASTDDIMSLKILNTDKKTITGVKLLGLVTTYWTEKDHKFSPLSDEGPVITKIVPNKALTIVLSNKTG